MGAALLVDGVEVGSEGVVCVVCGGAAMTPAVGVVEG